MGSWAASSVCWPIPGRLALVSLFTGPVGLFIPTCWRAVLTSSFPGTLPWKFASEPMKARHRQMPKESGSPPRYRNRPSRSDRSPKRLHLHCYCTDRLRSSGLVTLLSALGSNDVEARNFRASAVSLPNPMPHGARPVRVLPFGDRTLPPHSTEVVR